MYVYMFALSIYINISIGDGMLPMNDVPQKETFLMNRIKSNQINAVGTSAHAVIY